MVSFLQKLDYLNERSIIWFLDYTENNAEDSRLNNMFKKKYGASPSRVLTTSVFVSPVGKEHFEAYAPLTKDNHNFIQKAFGSDGVGETWCTRYNTF